MAEKSPLKQVEGEKALLEKISLAIPGFRGYKLKEMRREADKLIRDHIYRRLTGAKSSLREVSQYLASAKAMDAMKWLDKLIAKFDRVSELINHAPYGYGGFFDAVKIREDDLERMIEFDLRLVESAKEAEGKVRQFKQEVVGGRTENFEGQLGELLTLVDALENAFNERKEVIMGVEF